MPAILGDDEASAGVEDGVLPLFVKVIDFAVDEDEGQYAAGQVAGGPLGLGGVGKGFKDVGGVGGEEVEESVVEDLAEDFRGKEVDGEVEGA